MQLNRIHDCMLIGLKILIKIGICNKLGQQMILTDSIPNLIGQCSKKKNKSKDLEQFRSKSGFIPINRTIILWHITCRNVLRLNILLKPFMTMCLFYQPSNLIFIDFHVLPIRLAEKLYSIHITFTFQLATIFVCRQTILRDFPF